MSAFAEVQKVSLLFSYLPCQWFVCGGWAIDLFLDRVTRNHKDVDIAIARNDQFIIRDYLRKRGWTLDIAIDGKLLPWSDRERLSLPIHTVWCKNDNSQPDFIEILLNEIDEEWFRFRRDQSIQLARERMAFESSSGLPVLAPEIVLLYKSNRPQEYDADFQETFKSLAEESRVWLREALRKIYQQHPWADSL